MKYTKEGWGRLNPSERTWLVFYNKHCNEYNCAGGYLPDDSSECVICGDPMLGSGVCGNCLNIAINLSEKMKGGK